MLSGMFGQLIASDSKETFPGLLPENGAQEVARQRLLVTEAAIGNLTRVFGDNHYSEANNTEVLTDEIDKRKKEELRELSLQRAMGDSARQALSEMPTNPVKEDSPIQPSFGTSHDPHLDYVTALADKYYKERLSGVSEL